jgi:hypothetical protein
VVVTEVDPSVVTVVVVVDVVVVVAATEVDPSVVTVVVVVDVVVVSVIVKVELTVIVAVRRLETSELRVTGLEVRLAGILVVLSLVVSCNGAVVNVDIKVDTVMAIVELPVVMLVSVEAVVLTEVVIPVTKFKKEKEGCRKAIQLQLFKLQTLTTECLLKHKLLHSMIIAIGDEHVAIAIERECSWKGQL